MLPYLSFLHRPLILANKRPSGSYSPYPFHTFKTYSAKHIYFRVNGSFVAHNSSIGKHHTQSLSMIGNTLHRLMRFSHYVSLVTLHWLAHLLRICDNRLGFNNLTNLCLTRQCHTNMFSWMIFHHLHQVALYLT